MAFHVNHLPDDSHEMSSIIISEIISEKYFLKDFWWALRKLGVEEWIVRLVQGMYANARSRVHVVEGYSEDFEVKVGVHQG